MIDLASFKRQLRQLISIKFSNDVEKGLQRLDGIPASSVVTTDISASAMAFDYRWVRYRRVRVTQHRSESDIRREFQNPGSKLPMEHDKPRGLLVAQICCEPEWVFLSHLVIYHDEKNLRSVDRHQPERRD